MHAIQLADGVRDWPPAGDEQHVGRRERPDELAKPGPQRRVVEQAPPNLHDDHGRRSAASTATAYAGAHAETSGPRESLRDVWCGGWIARCARNSPEPETMYATSSAPPNGSGNSTLRQPV